MEDITLCILNRKILNEEWKGWGSLSLRLISNFSVRKYDLIDILQVRQKYTFGVFFIS